MIKIYNKDLDLVSTLNSGQCFRQIENEDGSFDIILTDRVINIRRLGSNLLVDSNKEDNLDKIVRHYFDLEYDYNKVNRVLLNKDKTYEKVISSNKGFRILNQDKFEMYISYIISQNNNVAMISKIIENISVKYGEMVIFKNKKYYLFPKANVLKNIDLKDLEEFKLGFRDKYIMNALNKLKQNENFLEELEEKSSEECLDELMNIKGIGMKVASCILLFSYHRLDVFPIDIWVKKYMTSRGINIKNIKSEMYNLFDNYSGLMIQYIFNYERNIKMVDKVLT